MPNPSQPALPSTGSDIFGEYGSAVTVSSAVIMMLAISAIDKVSSYDLHLGVLQLIPVAFATWAAGRNWGIALALAASGIWFIMFRGSPHFAWHPFYYWDVAVLLGTLVVFVLLIDRLHKELHRSDARFVKVLEGLDAAVYVADPQRGEILYGNAHFRETLAERPYDALAQYPAKETWIRWPDGRRVVLRIIQ
jgi:PAS domain-containing protein